MIPSLRSRLKPLAASLSAALAIGICSPLHATQTVTTCADSGSGSLRASVAAAAAGEMVDMTKLTCGTISLTTGAIAVPQNGFMTLLGPGANQLRITGEGSPQPDRIFNHTGNGTLYLAYLSLDHDTRTTTGGAAQGGCIYSGSNVLASSVSISSCTATAMDENAMAQGGGLFVRGLPRTSARSSSSKAATTASSKTGSTAASSQC